MNEKQAMKRKAQRIMREAERKACEEWQAANSIKVAVVIIKKKEAK